MAQVEAKHHEAPPAQSTEIDRKLEYQLQAWRGVPEQAAWWPQMDAGDKEAFQLEWAGITEGRLRDLETLAASGILSSVQRARYAELQALVAEQRPVLARLFAS
jgi:hypothetical protein